MTKVTIFGNDQDMINVNGGNWKLDYISTSRRFNGNTYNPTRATLDEIKWKRYFSKSGTYRVRMIADHSTMNGIVDMGINKTEETTNNDNIFDGLDTYDASGTVKNVISETIVEVARGMNEVNFKINGKHPSSAHYYMYITLIEFTLISEHSVLNSDAPARDIFRSHTLLYSETSTADGTSMTFTPSVPINTRDYDSFLIKLDPRSLGGGEWGLRINTAGTQAYYYSGRRISTAGTETIITGTYTAKFRIGGCGAYVGNDLCIVEIWLEEGNDMPIIHAWSHVGQSQNEEVIIGHNNNANSFDTLVNLEVSHSIGNDLGSGSVFKVWGVNKH